jgi:hypothetical protein
MPYKDPEKRRASSRQAGQRVRDRQAREAKELGLSFREYRKVIRERNDTRVSEGEKPVGAYVKRKGYGTNVAMYREIVDNTPVSMNLKDLDDTGNAYPICKDCKNPSVFDSYFCPRCGQHQDWLYGLEHLNGPRVMTREEILAEYAEAEMPFERQDYSPGTLRINGMADAFGIDPDAEMPKPQQGEDQWKGLLGFRSDREYSPSI